MHWPGRGAAAATRPASAHRALIDPGARLGGFAGFSLLLGDVVGVGRQGQHVAAVPEPLRNLDEVDAVGKPQRCCRMPQSNPRRVDPGGGLPSAPTGHPTGIPGRVLHPDALADVATPLLPDAACRDHWELFDRTISGPTGHKAKALTSARGQALAAVCTACPALAPWRDRPPRRRPSGVIAGQVSQKRPPGYQQLAHQ